MISGLIAKLTLKEKERFLDNSCSVSISKSGLVEEADIFCRTDEGPKSFKLIISPKIKIEIKQENLEIKTVDVAVGEKIYEMSQYGKSVYLGYIGETEKGVKFIIPVVSPKFTSEAFKETLIYRQLNNAVKTAQFESGNVLANLITGILKSGGLSISTAINFLITGNYPVGWIYEEGSNKKTENADVMDKFFSLIGGVPFIDIILGNKIQFHGLAEPTDRKFGSSDEEKKQEENYENAISDYRKIIDSFPSVSYSQTETFGEKALIQAINVAYDAGQKRKSLELCDEFKERYPESNLEPDICGNSLRISSSGISEFGVVINGNAKIISLEGINEPTLDEFSAEIFVRGPDGRTSFKLRKNQMRNKLKKLPMSELRKLALYLQVFIEPRLAGYKVAAVTDEIKARLFK
ncbi:MAG: hypothetical protein IIB81_03535 [Nanoarchaeota archaeon]|nr:hypothetical protein [Nanoarchaeota archaeon]